MDQSLIFNADMWKSKSKTQQTNHADVSEKYTECFMNANVTDLYGYIKIFDYQNQALLMKPSENKPKRTALPENNKNNIW